MRLIDTVHYLILQCVDTVIVYVCGAVEAKGVEMNTYKEVQFVTLRGQEITDDFVMLTNGGSGTMMFWMSNRREAMLASAIMHGGKFIGWSACLKEEDGIYSIGTYIAEEYRKQGLGQMALIRLLMLVKQESPSAYVKAGFSRYEQFDVTYERTIIACGLRWAKFFTSNESLKQAA